MVSKVTQLLHEYQDLSLTGFLIMKRIIEVVEDILSWVEVRSQVALVSGNVKCPYFGASRVTTYAEEGKMCRSLKYDRWKKSKLAAPVRYLYLLPVLMRSWKIYRHLDKISVRFGIINAQL